MELQARPRRPAFRVRKSQHADAFPRVWPSTAEASVRCRAEPGLARVRTGLNRGADGWPLAFALGRVVFHQVCDGWEDRNVDILELPDVVALLRSEVAKAGSQQAWAKMTGFDRTVLNQILRGRRPPTPHVIELLKLRVIFTPVDGTGSQEEKLRSLPKPTNRRSGNRRKRSTRRRSAG